MRDGNHDLVEAYASVPLWKRVRSGLQLNFISLIFGRSLWLVRSVVFARLLAPDDFGLFGMCVATLTALTALTNPGVDASLVVSKSSKSGLAAQLNTVWTVELIRRAALTLLLLAAVYPTARFYNQESLVALLPIISFIPLIEGLRNIGLVIYYKQVDFRQVVRFEQATNIASTVITIVLALVTRNVWALVLGHLLSSLAGVFLSYWFHPYRPRFEISRAALASALVYGKYGFVISVGLFITTTADNIFIGKMLGAAALGIYVLAYGIASFPVEVIGSVLNSVMFPAFAEISAGERTRLESAFARALRFGLAISLLSVVPMVLVADEIVIVAFGAKWAAAGPVLRLLCMVGFWRALTNNISPFLISQRAPRPEAIAKVIEAALFLLLLYPLVNHSGLMGAALAGGIVYFLAAINRLFFVRAINRGAFRKALWITGIALLSGAAAVACGAFVLSFVAGALIRLITGLVVSTLITSMMLVLMQPEMRKDIAALWKTGRLSRSIEDAQAACP